MENSISTEMIILDAKLPRKTQSYSPVSNKLLIDTIQESIQKCGMKIDSKSFSQTNNGNVCNGRFVIADVADDIMQLQIGFQNSYDKTLSLKFAVGTQIIVCSNGCVSGEFGAFKRKHTGGVQEISQTEMVRAINNAQDVFKKMQGERELMKEIEITERTKAELIGRMMIEEGFIQSTQLNIIRREMQKPTHDYRAKDSLWELYQHTTFAMKNVNPYMYMENHIRAHRFFVSQANEILS